MKHLKRKIALLALTSLLAVGQGMANESVVSSTNSFVGEYSHFSGIAGSERGTSKLLVSPKLIDVPLLVAQCTLKDPLTGREYKGVLCKDGRTCVKSANFCPNTPPSQSYKETTLDSEGI